MKLTKLLKYELHQAGSLIYICILIPVLLFFMQNMDFKNDKKKLDDLIDKHGSIERAIEEDPDAVDLLKMHDSIDTTIMLGAGLFGGSIGLITELFGIAMQMGVSRKKTSIAYLIFSAIFTVFFSLALWGASIAIKEIFVSGCTGVYEFLKPEYEAIDVSLKQLGKYILAGIPIMITGASFWLITTRIKKTVVWVATVILIMFGTVFGTVMAFHYELTWLMYLIFGAGSLAMIVTYFVLLRTETVEHKLR